VVDEILVGELGAMKGIDENHYMRKNYSKKKIIVGGKSVSQLEMLNDVKLSSKFVLENPDAAEKLLDRINEQSCFKEEAKMLGRSYYIAYCHDSDRGLMAKHIGQYLGIDNSISSRDVEGEGEMINLPTILGDNFKQGKGYKRGNPGARNKTWADSKSH